MLLAVGIAAPYVPVSERETVEETVNVVDDSASMATETASGSRFERAVDAAPTSVTGKTSIVSTAGGSTVAVQRGTPDEARDRLDRLRVTASPGDLRRAISEAGALAGEDARVVVLSGFAGDDWLDPGAIHGTRTDRVDGDVVLAEFGAQVRLMPIIAMFHAAYGDRLG